MLDQYKKNRMGLSPIVFTQWSHNFGTHKTDTLYYHYFKALVARTNRDFPEGQVPWVGLGLGSGLYLGLVFWNMFKTPCLRCWTAFGE